MYNLDNDKKLFPKNIYDLNKKFGNKYYQKYRKLFQKIKKIE